METNDILKIIGRSEPIFLKDVLNNENQLCNIVQNSSFLIVGGAGSIGKSLSMEIFKRNPKKIHIIDISENSLVELVRYLRSTKGYISGEFKTFVMDFGSNIFFQMLENNQYDYIINVAAMKHVRNEKDKYSLMRMIDTNIMYNIKLLRFIRKFDLKNYFCVSTDKAVNPANLMGATKRIMEKFLMVESSYQNISTARFANVAFSSGSLLDGFKTRLFLKQPITVPKVISRYFITDEEAGQLCLLSTILSKNKDIFFPKSSDKLKLTLFTNILKNFLCYHGYEPYLCSSEEEARVRRLELIKNNKWPCYFFESDTSGEKIFEEFFQKKDVPDIEKFEDIAVLSNNEKYNQIDLSDFIVEIERLQKKNKWSKKNLLELIFKLVPEINHVERNKSLDERM